MTAVESFNDQLIQVLNGYPHIAVAVSGGVDSLTLATFAHRYAISSMEVFHAVSPAVPEEATRRVQAYAEIEDWVLKVVDAGEFADPDYRANPVNRCYYCKSHLYAAIAAQTSGQIVSGTNLDDLGEYRPGLEAASQQGVRHPYVEAGIDKQSLRSIARQLGLEDIAELPASPCLSSRIETAIVIEPQLLELVHSMEKFVGELLRAETVRCRVRASGLVIELDPSCLQAITETQATLICDKATALALAQASGRQYSVSFESYQNGSAFLHQQLMA